MKLIGEAVQVVGKQKLYPRMSASVILMNTAQSRWILQSLTCIRISKSTEPEIVAQRIRWVHPEQNNAVIMPAEKLWRKAAQSP